MAVVLVTGGAGYIGSHACKGLAEAGHVPVCFDNFTTGWRDAARFGPVAAGDLLEPGSLARAFVAFRPDAVMHFAALSLVAESVAAPALYWRANVGGTLNLLEAMRAAGVGALAFSSTAAIYGEAEAEAIAEDAPALPVNPYGASKLAAERMIADFGRAHGLRVMAFRYFNVAGADRLARIGEWRRHETHLIPLVLDAAAGAREAIAICGDDYPTPDGACVRDYLHVEDLVGAHILGLERLLAGGEGATLNLGAGRGFSVIEVIDRAEDVTGVRVPRVRAARRPGDPARLVCDASRAARILGWKPQFSDLDTMIADAWRWRRTGGYAR